MTGLRINVADLPARCYYAEGTTTASDRSRRQKGFKESLWG
jgi:hypothetical protein